MKLAIIALLTLLTVSEALAQIRSCTTRCYPIGGGAQQCTTTC